MQAAGDPELKVYGIFGYPLGHTVSPAIQNRAFDEARLKSIYFSFERTPSRFKYLMRHLKLLLLDGFNLTVPFKESVIPHLQRLSPEARKIGAVNTVKREGRRWVGYNTDVGGFRAGLREKHYRVKGQSAVVLGAGGSARSVVCALAEQGASRITIANRTTTKAHGLAKRFNRMFPKVLVDGVGLKGRAFERALAQSSLIVNATKVGLRKQDPSLVPAKLFPKGKILVYDLIYRPRETKLLAGARQSGHRTQNGETMLLHQGAEAFEIWTGKRAPIQKMRQALLHVLASD